MIVNVTGAGTVPIGGIIAVGDVAAWVLPSSGEIKDGFVLCDGTAFPAGSHPSFSGNRPNLTDDRFLNGSSSTGGTGGSTAKNPTFDKNVMNTNQTAHTHGMDHRHQTMYQSPAGAGGTVNYSWGAYKADGTPQTFVNHNTFSNGTGSPLAYAQIVYPSGDLYTGYNLYSGNSISISPATTSRTSTDTSTVSWASTAVTVSISDIRPNYLNVVYLMRVI